MPWPEASTSVDEIVMFLRAVGLRSARRDGPVPDGPLTEPALETYIIGLPWTLLVRAHTEGGLSHAIDKVSAEAVTTGADLFALVQPRAGRDASEALVSMPMRVYAHALHLLHPRAVTGQLSSGIRLLGYLTTEV